MRKRNLSLLMVLMASLIWLAHAFVPHHHDHHHDHLSGHNPAQHHHHDDESNPLGHLFSHLSHSEDGFTPAGSHTFGKSLIKQFPVVAALTPATVAVNFPAVTRDVNYTPPDIPRCISTITRFSGLRAPPFYLA